MWINNHELYLCMQSSVFCISIMIWYLNGMSLYLFTCMIHIHRREPTFMFSCFLLILTQEMSLSSQPFGWNGIYTHPLPTIWFWVSPWRTWWWPVLWCPWGLIKKSPRNGCWELPCVTCGRALTFWHVSIMLTKFHTFISGPFSFQREMSRENFLISETQMSQIQLLPFMTFELVQNIKCDFKEHLCECQCRPSVCTALRVITFERGNINSSGFRQYTYKI